MPDLLISSQDILRYIHRSTGDPTTLPRTQLPTIDDPAWIDIFKGEIVVNHSSDAPGIWIRTGNSVEESTQDQLVRIGNVIIGDVEPFSGAAAVNKQGIFWYNTRQQHLYVWVRTQWVRITSEVATELVQGVVRQATEAEVLAGAQNSTYVTPANLLAWREYYELVSRRRGGSRVYVDPNNGDDSLENDGSDINYPFLTLNRALLESVRRPGIKSVYLTAAEYIVDNRRGSTDFTSINSPWRTEGGQLYGPVNPKPISGALAISGGEEQPSVINVASAIAAEQLFPGQQVFFVRDELVVGSGLIADDGIRLIAENNTQVTFKLVRGRLEQDCQLFVSGLRDLNAVNSGVIVPRSLTIIGEPGTVLRPRFITNINSPQASWLLKLTPHSVLEGLRFEDQVGVEVSHYWYTALTTTTIIDLIDEAQGYYLKCRAALGDSELWTIPSEVENVFARRYLTIKHCAVETHYGANFIKLKDHYLTGIKRIVFDDFMSQAEQLDERAYEVDDLTELLEGQRHSMLDVMGPADSDYVISFEGVGYSANWPNHIKLENEDAASVNLGSHEVIPYSPPVIS
jgi:hypothetical protein